MLAPPVSTLGGLGPPASYAHVVAHLGWDTLESRRTKAQLTMLYKITTDLVDIPAANHLIPVQSNTRSSHSRNYQQPSASTSYFKNSFFPRTIAVWNKLPAAVAEAPDLVSFKQGLSTLSF